MKVTALVDRFGSNRINAHRPAELLKSLTPRITCVNVPFAGGMCEVAWFDANVINVNDLDRHVMNLAQIVKLNRVKLAEHLDATPFHPDVLKTAQEFCRDVEDRFGRELIHFWGGTLDIDALINHLAMTYLTHQGKANP